MTFNAFGDPSTRIQDRPHCRLSEPKGTKYFKGGGAVQRAATPAQATTTPELIGQAQRDELGQEQDRRKRNNPIIGAGSETLFGNKLKLGQ